MMYYDDYITKLVGLVLDTTLLSSFWEGTQTNNDDDDEDDYEDTIK